MQWVSKAVNYYKDINPSTLTGAIDVIVVERPTDSGGVELACSPFHVRFGKLSVLRPVDKKVRINVNDERVPFYMKVGETGEAFFVFETEDDVPADMQTSPLSGPVSDDGRSDAGEMEPLDLDAPALDQREGSLGDQEADEDQPITPTPSHPASPDSSRYVSLAGTQANSPTTSFRPFPGAPFLPNVGSGSPSRKGSAEVNGKPLVESPADEDGPGADEGEASTKRKAYHVPTPFAAAAGKAAGLGAAAISRPVQELHDARLRARAQGASLGTAERRRRSLRDEHDLKGEPQEVGQPSESMRADLAGLSLDGDKRDGQADAHHSDQTGDAVIRSARDRDADVRAMLGGKEGLGYAVGADGRPAEHEFSLRPFATGETKVDVGKHLRTSSGHEIGSAPENAGSLMLDMSGYKLDPGKEEGSSQSKRAQQEIEGSGAMVLDEKAEKEIIAFTQALLQSTDPTTLRSFFDEEENRSRASSPVPPLDLNDPRATSEPESKSGLPPRSRTSSRASSPPRPISIQDLHAIHADSEHASSPDDGVYHASPKQFTLKTGGSMHVFELSLCGSEGFDQLERAAVDRIFREHQVTFNEFMEQETIPDSPYLVVKYSSRYLTWDNASPVLASLAVYRKSLVEHPEHHRHVDESAQQSKASHRRGWSLWWGRGRSETPPATDATSVSSMPTAETSPPTSPPESPPDSPRSLPVADTPPFNRRATDGDDEFPPEDHSKHYAKTLRLTSDQLKALGLKKGMNTISFSVRSSYSGYATCTSRIFLWESDFQVVISDIDGTITKSDALGHVFTMIGRDWTHLGVAKLYTDISRNGYKLMYLTSRAIGQADTTREYLKGIKQNGFQLPDGPVIMSPDRLMTSLHREVIMRKPEVFKMACLRDIQRLFGERSPFYAGFGNRITDALSYRSVDIPSSRIFTIDSNGEVKMELLELAGYKSSYIHMTDLVDQMFPPINRVSAPDYTDFNYWRTPLPSIDIDIPELQPPSPALSARSDQSTSRISLSRLGNLASSLSRRSSRNTLNDAASATSRTARGQTPTSPLLQATVPEEHGEEEEDDDESFLGNRSRSSSMPGSLPTESDFERYRAMASTASGRAQGTTEAEEYKKKVRAAGHAEDDVDDEYDEDEAHDDEDVGEADDFGDQLDFSSVPYL